MILLGEIGKVDNVAYNFDFRSASKAQYASPCQISHNHKDRQVLFVGGPNTRKTNPRWRTAAILKIINRPYLRNGSTDLREIWHGDAYWAFEADRKSKLYATLSTLPISPNKITNIIKTKTGFSFSSL